jgi:hypothetical protein
VQSCQVPKLFSGQYMKKFGQFWQKFGQFSHKKQNSVQSKGQQNCKINFVIVSECLSLPVKEENSFKNLFGPFSDTFGKIRSNFGHKFFRPTFFFSPAPFELFGRNFGHLATLIVWRALHVLRTTLYLLTTNAKSCSDLAEIFSVASFI